MKIRNVDFEFNPYNARYADRITHAIAGLQEAQAAAQQVDQSDFGGAIAFQCAAVDAFLSELLGEDYDERLGIDVDDLLELKRVSEEVMAQMNAARREMEAFTQQAGAAAPTAAPGVEQPAAASVDFAKMNRAQRRAAVRALRGNHA